MQDQSYHWNFAIIWDYRAILLQGLGVTVTIAALTILLGIILGIILALLRSSSSKWIRLPTIGFIEIVRAVPSLVLLVWMYYCLPILTGITLTAFATSVLALAVYSSAFFAEIFRAGLQSIEKGYVEAGYSTGMTRGQVLTRIVGPLAFQRICPPLVSQCIQVIKNTSLVGYVALADILYAGQEISIQTFRPIEILTAVAVMFIAIILPLTITANFLEASYRRKYYS